MTNKKYTIVITHNDKGITVFRENQGFEIQELVGHISLIQSQLLSVWNKTLISDIDTTDINFIDKDGVKHSNKITK